MYALIQRIAVESIGGQDEIACDVAEVPGGEGATVPGRGCVPIENG